MSRLDSDIYDAQSYVNKVIDFLEGLQTTDRVLDLEDEIGEAITYLNDANSRLDDIESAGDDLEREIDHMEEGIDPSDALYTIESIESSIGELKRDLGSF